MSDIKSNYQKYHSHISSKHRWFDLKLREVWQYKDLIWLFTKRSFVVTYKQTILGPAWLVLNPVITSFIYAFVFGGIAGMGTDDIPQMAFYMTSTAIWTFFAACLTNNASTFTANASVFGKVYFPRLTTPISNVLSSIIQFMIQFAIAFAFVVYYVIIGQISPNWWAFSLIPLVLIHLGIMGMGLGIIISSMTTKYRDLSVLVGFGVSLWMYATPIVYPLSQLDTQFNNNILKTIFMINPVTMPVEILRYAVLGKGTIDPIFLTTSLIFTILVIVFGIMVFNRVERTFMDTV